VRGQKETITLVRRRFMAAVAIDHSPRRTTRGWLARIARVAPVLTAVAVAWISHRLFQRSPAAGLVSLPVAWLLIGSRFRALGNMMHECAHRTFTGRASWDRAFGHLLGFFDFTDFKQYVHEHFTHHQQLGGDGDLDARPRRELFEALGPLSGRYIVYALTLRHLPRYVRPVFFSRNDSLPVGVARTTFNLSLLAVAHFVIGWQPFLLYYLTPYLTTYQMFRFFSDASDHAGIIAEPDEFLRSRNHLHRWSWVNWLLYPGRDQYHLVHHLFPNIPCAQLARVHQLLLAIPEYAAREHDLTRLLRANAAA
jgi:fatty acid desaturase